MKEIQLTIIAKSPLSIGRKKPGSVSEAADYIPGSVIRGAVASHLLRLAGDTPEPGDDFSAIFTEDNAAVFCNAYPTQNGAKVAVLPATAVSAKANPGFQPKGYGVFDTLIDRFCAESFNQLYDPNCPKALDAGDNGRVEPFGGFYICDNSKYQSQSVPKRLLTRVGINRRRATSEEQILYSVEVLNEVRGEGEHSQSTTYRSSILIADDTLAQRLQNFLNSHRFRLGGSTSRGLGRVEIVARCVESDPEARSRVKEFNEKLNHRWQKWEAVFGGGTPFSRTYFTVNLQADAILVDNWKRTTVVTPEMLRQFTEVNDDSLQLHTVYSSYDYISGWNAAWGLMKDIDLVTNKGSVYLFSTEQIDQWDNALATLEQKGIGERTLEGFGQVEICNQFHSIFREDAV